MAEIKSTLDIIEQVKALPWKSAAQLKTGKSQGFA
jgi:hypothetical protein